MKSITCPQQQTANGPEIKLVRPDPTYKNSNTKKRNAIQKIQQRPATKRRICVSSTKDIQKLKSISPSFSDSSTNYRESKHTKISRKRSRGFASEFDELCLGIKRLRTPSLKTQTKKKKRKNPFDGSDLDEPAAQRGRCLTSLGKSCSSRHNASPEPDIVKKHSTALISYKGGIDSTALIPYKEGGDSTELMPYKGGNSTELIPYKEEEYSTALIPYKEGGNSTTLIRYDPLEMNLRTYRPHLRLQNLAEERLLEKYLDNHMDEDKLTDFDTSTAKLDDIQMDDSCLYSSNTIRIELVD